MSSEILGNDLIEFRSWLEELGTSKLTEAAAALRNNPNMSDFRDDATNSANTIPISKPLIEKLIKTTQASDRISTSLKVRSDNLEEDILIPQLANFWKAEKGKISYDELTKFGNRAWNIKDINAAPKIFEMDRKTAEENLVELSAHDQSFREVAHIYKAKFGDDIFKVLGAKGNDKDYQALLGRKPTSFDKAMIDSQIQKDATFSSIDRSMKTGRGSDRDLLGAIRIGHLKKYGRIPKGFNPTMPMFGDDRLYEMLFEDRNLDNCSKYYRNIETDALHGSFNPTRSMSRTALGYPDETTSKLFPPQKGNRASSLEVELEGGSKTKTIRYIKGLKGKDRALFEKFITLDPDGSLIDNGLEIGISKIGRKDLAATLRLVDKIKNTGGWSSGSRTSTHNHVDARDLIYDEKRQLRPKVSQMLTYLKRNDHLMETVLDKSRIGNKFSQRAKLLDDPLQAKHYSNIVSASMFKWGTYENRALGGTSDPSKVLNWYDFNQSLVAKNASSDLSKLPYYEKFSDMTKAVGAPKSTVDYYRDLERKMDPMSRNIIPVHPRSLLEGEKLYDAQGKLKPIEQFQIGDEILSYDVENHKLVTSYVVDKFDHLADNVCTATLQTSRKSEQARLTSDHPTLTTGNTYVPINEDKEWVWLPGQTLAAWRINHNPILKAKQISNRSKGEAHSKATQKGMTDEVKNRISKQAKANAEHSGSILKDHSKLCQKLYGTGRLPEIGKLVSETLIMRNKTPEGRETRRRAIILERETKGLNSLEKQYLQLCENNDLPVEVCCNPIGSIEVGWIMPDFEVVDQPKVVEIFFVNPNAPDTKTRWYLHRGEEYIKERTDFCQKFGFKCLCLPISSTTKWEDVISETRKFINNGVRTKLAPISGTHHVWDLQCEPYKNFVHESGLVLHNCRCYWEKVRVLLAKISSGFGTNLLLMGNGLEIVRKAQSNSSEHFVFSEDHIYNTLRWYKRDEYSSRKKIFNELLKVDPSEVPDKLLIQPDHDIGIKIPETRAMSLITQAMKDSDHAPTVALQEEFRKKLDDDMRRYQIKAAKRIQSSLADLKNGKIDRIEARRQFDSARLSMKHLGVQAIKSRTQQITQSSVVESAMEEGVEVLIFRTRPYKACRVCKALDGKHFRVEDVKPLEPNVQNALGVPDKDLFKPKPARMSTRKSHRRVILMRDGSRFIRH